MLLLHCSTRSTSSSTSSSGVSHREGRDERLAELCFEGVKKTKSIDVDEE